MLKSLRVQRYQSHDDTTFNFHPGINGIIGLSLSGKTAILRAIKNVLSNRPSGFRFHSRFSKKDTITSIDLDNKISVVKRRGLGKSGSYTLRLPDQKPIRFPKVGKNVPDLVTQHLNFSELNIQNQLDSPFLITSSPGEIARAMSRITKAEALNEWVKTLNSEIGVLKYKKELELDDLKKAKQKLKRFKKMEEADQKITILEKVTKKIKKLEEEFAGIDELLANIKDYKESIKAEERYLKAKEHIDEIEGIRRKKQVLENESDFITNRIITTQNKLRETTIEHKRLGKRYTRELERAKKCPTCFHNISTTDVRRIAREVSTLK